MTDAWDLTAKERAAVVDSIANGITSICFSNNRPVPMDIVELAAKYIETKSYNRAKVESQTTTGSRPRKEVEEAYLRIVSQLVFEAAESGCENGAARNSSTVDDSRLDLSTSGREFVTKELAEQYFGSLLQDGSTVSSIKLSTKSLGLDSAPVVAKAISNIKDTLRDADISDIIAGRPEKEVLEVLRTVSQALAACDLRSLNISDNALGEKGIRACEAVLTSQSALEELYLQNIGCSVNACKAVNELVKCPTLQKLHLFNNMSDDEGAAAIAALLQRNPGMKDFKMVSSRVGYAGGTTLSSALCAGTSLEKLDLSDNPMEPAVGPAIASLVRHQSSLLHLLLNDLCLADEGVTTLAAALAEKKTCPELQTLELALNEITRESSAALVPALASKVHLRRLNLAENELECAGAVHIAVGLKNATALQSLDLRTNQIGRVGALAVVRSCCAAASGLQQLDLDDNQISADGVDEIMKLVKETFSGQEVLGSLDDNDPDGDPDDEDVLEDAMGDLGSLELDLSSLTL